MASAGSFVILTSLEMGPITQQELSYASFSDVTNDYEQPILPQVSSWNTWSDVADLEFRDSDPSMFSQ